MHSFDGWGSIGVMRPSLQPEEAHANDHLPLACPVCHDDFIEAVEGVSLSASNTGRNVGHKQIGRVSVYRCNQWHVFALFGHFVGERSL